MMRYAALLPLLIIGGCTLFSPVVAPPVNLASEVNPFIGTGGHGHTYPGATAPFGMVQLSPDTRLDGWDGCSGYHYSDNSIYGFSHTHLQGTGVSDYGDILFMPTNGKTRQSPKWNEAWKSSFQHSKEQASAGYYSVFLDDYSIQAELTATTRTGIHRYTLTPGDTCRLFLDFMHRDNLLFYDVRTYGDTAISGYRVSQGWADEQHCYFYAVFSRPFLGMEQLMQRSESTDPLTGERRIMLEDIQAFALQFNPKSIFDRNELMIKVGISGVDETGAMQNLYAEAPHWSFEQYRQNAANQWNEVLRKAPVPVRSDLTADERVSYYTALYHCYTVPNTWSDVDQRFRGMDKKIHVAEGYTRYTVFSLWDTFRAYHPLMCKLEPERTRDWIVTFLEMYKERGELPVWELAGNETYCMIGYHSVPVIYDAWCRGIRDFDTSLALEAMIASASGPQEEKKLYEQFGYVPGDQVSESVSKTLEFAYDDYCIAQFAKELGRQDIYKRFIRRSQSWKHHFDPISGFMRPRRNGGFPEPFDPYQVDFNYTEANAWQYSLFVPHQVDELAALMGGKDALVASLDRLFSAPSQTTGREQADITGLIGQYAHGNEPSHHVPFMYALAGSDKYIELTRKICDEFYRNTPDGLCGNEDCGQMSAWYVCVMQDFYPFMAGKEITGVMSGKPRTSPFSYSPPESIPASLQIIPLPIISGPSTSFRDSALVTVRCAKDADHIVEITQGTRNERLSPPYQFYIHETTNVLAWDPSQPELASRASFVKRSGNRSVIYTSGYDNQYSGGGMDALVDEIRGGFDFRTGQWQGYWRKEMEVIIDLGEEKAIYEMGLGCYQDIRPWIWMPGQIDFYAGTDTTNFMLFGSIQTDYALDREGPQQKDFMIKSSFERPAKYRYVKVIAKAPFETIPSWHLGSGGQPWIFVDEVIVK